MSESYDLAVLGAGPGGYTAAILAARKGLKVALAEGSRFGGTCTNTGCIPTKTYLESARVFALARDAARFGVSVENPRPDFARMKSRKDRVVSRLAKGVEHLLKSNGVDILPVEAAIERPGVIRAGNTLLSARHTIIATGSKPKRPSIFDSPGIWTSDEVFDVSELPESLAIIGAGAIGMEMAHLFSTLGVRVTLIEALDRVLPMEDSHVSSYMSRLMRKTSIHTSARVTRFEGSGPYRLTVETQAGETLVEAHRVLLCIGRTPRIPDGCEASGIELGRAGGIAVDEFMRTSVPGIYAVGDVTGEHMYAYVASREAAVAVNHITGGSRRISYRNIPSAIFTHPEVASVGDETGADGSSAELTGTFPVSALGRARTMEANDGYAHITASADGVIRRVSIVSPEATDLISWACLAVELGLTVEQFLDPYCPHPTLAEILKEAAEDILGAGVHKV
ncbi:MAG: dihydrolipoyl dehydrogenase [Desulfomonilia bacterium]|jgi:dihydrolipoamide dehydrogenase